jgi:ubiquinone/menaquinone biosynthesis C-methylase UbiE
MINENLGAKDINTWILDNLNPQENQKILDLGCGSGKQLIPIINITRNSGKYHGVDISAEAIKDLRIKLLEYDLLDNVTLDNIDIDKINILKGEHKFDRILGSYSLYYTKDTSMLLYNISLLLKKDGIFFYCGPSNENNIELKMFLNSIKKGEEKHSFASHFMEETSIEFVKKYFNNHEISFFENNITFYNVESLYAYWSSHNLYDETIDKEFRDAANDHLRCNHNFITAKRAIGIKCFNKG